MSGTEPGGEDGSHRSAEEGDQGDRSRAVRDARSTDTDDLSYQSTPETKGPRRSTFLVLSGPVETKGVFKPNLKSRTDRKSSDPFIYKKEYSSTEFFVFNMTNHTGSQ